MNQLLSKFRICDFTTLLQAYTKSGTSFDSAIDGGAGWGNTSEAILKFLENTGVVYAFEPFRGNHRFFWIKVQE